MKLLCLILALYVIQLSGQPCCYDKDYTNKVSSKKEQTNKATSKDKECQGCSPFFTCGSCIGFIVSMPLYVAKQLIPDQQAEAFPSFQQPFIHQVALSIWLPPKLS